MSEEKPTEPPSNVLDLDAYRKQRQDEGTWPPTKEEHEQFFRRWKESKKR